VLKRTASRWILPGVVALAATCLLPACSGHAAQAAPKGKVRVELQVSPLAAAAKGAAGQVLAKADIDRTLQVLQARVEGYGLPVPQARFRPPDRIILEVAAEQPEEQLLEGLKLLLTKRGLLEVRAIPTEYAQGHEHAPVADNTTGSLVYTFTDRTGKEVPVERVLAKSRLLASSRDLVPNARAESRPRQGGSPTQFVPFELQEPERGRFRAFTRTHVGTRIAFVLDGDLLTCPIIMSEIDGSNAILVPDRPGWPEFPKLLAIMINTGPLPLAVRWVGAAPVQGK
jgi:preprotein translocase subunit SecD